MAIGNGDPISPFGAIPVISIINDKVMEGITYSIRKRFTIVASGVLNLIFDPTAFTGKNIVTLPIGFDSLGGPINVDIFPGALANDDGTMIMPFNRDFLKGSPQSIFREAPTGIDITGVDPIEIFLPSDGTGAAGSSGSSSEDPLVSNIDFAVKYLLRFTNTDGSSSCTVGIKFDFFEVL